MASMPFRRGMLLLETLIRAQISQFELFELILLLKLDKQFPVEQFEAAMSQSTVPSPPLKFACVYIYIYMYMYMCIYIYIYIYRVLVRQLPLTKQAKAENGQRLPAHT